MNLVFEQRYYNFTTFPVSFDLTAAAEEHRRQDTACIIYTSGTGGNPKGVMLSHGAMLTNSTGAKYLLKEIISNLDIILCQILGFLFNSL